jgi:hypothetical protein
MGGITTRLGMVTLFTLNGVNTKKHLLCLLGNPHCFSIGTKTVFPCREGAPAFP